MCGAPYYARNPLSMASISTPASFRIFFGCFERAKDPKARAPGLRTGLLLAKDAGALAAIDAEKALLLNKP